MPTSMKSPLRRAEVGDIVTVDLNLSPENGYVPHPLFDTTGEITFVLGWGNYLPALHSLIEGMHEGESVSDVSIDAGWGKRRSDLIVTVAKSKLKSLKDTSVLKPGYRLHLEGDVQVVVTDVSETTVTVDANHPLAGASYNCSLTVTQIDSFPKELLEYNKVATGDLPEDFSNQMPGSRFQVATFGLGCFWGAQLAFSRLQGVVGTKSGYTQGVRHNPTYEQVCEGKTKHREAVLVLYDSTVVTYSELLNLALERLDQTTDAFKLAELFQDDDSLQYRHGFYYHTDEQHRQAKEFLGDNARFCGVELLAATRFYDAEDYHQHYLLKGGQSARKGAKETIRCFG